MKRSLLLIAALSAGLALTGCGDGNAEKTSDSNTASAGQADHEQTLTGTLSLASSDQPLPDNTQVVVSLNDATLADAPAKVIAENRVDMDQNSVDFHLNYASDEVDPSHRHLLRAEIHDANGELKWTTTDAYLVSVGNDAEQSEVAIVLHPVDANGQAQGASLQQAQEQLLSSGDEPTQEEVEAAENLDAISEQSVNTQKPEQPAVDGSNDAPAQ
ncbi:YbaY family lipoprotein [Halomonas binhaiensis]|uniref:YbaY family lipoprotein n=1 Tax=Halomonas binhaiensis TaxID=2562282 RepID=A0A856QSK2_9GAMM|nr:YbaY family lipoprotein [Halomonas binhaiensis]QEM82880.2 YbaY family lipoprotein [Halomonas binhaiensis]